MDDMHYLKLRDINYFDTKTFMMFESHALLLNKITIIYV